MPKRKNASDLTLYQRFNIVAGYIEFKEWKTRQKDAFIYVADGRDEYIIKIAQERNLHEDTVRLVLMEGITCA